MSQKKLDLIREIQINEKLAELYQELRLRFQEGHEEVDENTVEDERSGLDTPGQDEEDLELDEEMEIEIEFEEDEEETKFFELETNEGSGVLEIMPVHSEEWWTNAFINYLEERPVKKVIAIPQTKTLVAPPDFEYTPDNSYDINFGDDDEDE